MLNVEGLFAGYGRATALRGVSLEVGPGQSVGIIGSNGAGKSTLLNCISGLIKPSDGSITFRGTDITGSAAARTARMGLVQVPEGRKIFATLSVRENLEVAGSALRRRQRDVAVGEQLDMFSILREKADHSAGSLSGGQQQMLAIARALMGRPQLLMLDEPSLGLAPIVVDQVFDALRELRDQGLTVLMVEQNASRALEYVSYCYVLERGQVVSSGTSTEVAADETVIDHYLAVPRTSASGELLAREGSSMQEK